MMKPILFNTEMVKAILDGRKTQTRRVVPKIKGNPNLGYCDWEDKFWITWSNNNELQDKHKKIYSKYNKGDILYVRETFVENYMNADGYRTPEVENIYYRADDEHLAYVDDDDEPCNTPWKPSIHMPKEFARIFLKVTSVRVERLRDIGVHDIWAEGTTEILDTEMSWKCDAYDGYTPEEKAIGSYRKLWNSTAPDSYKWEDNSYVFVYEFERVDNDIE